MVLTALRSRRGDLSGGICSLVGEAGATVRVGPAIDLTWMLDLLFLLGKPRFEGGNISTGIMEPSDLMT